MLLLGLALGLWQNAKNNNVDYMLDSIFSFSHWQNLQNYVLYLLKIDFPHILQYFAILCNIIWVSDHQTVFRSGDGVVVARLMLTLLNILDWFLRNNSAGNARNCSASYKSYLFQVWHKLMKMTNKSGKVQSKAKVSTLLKSHNLSTTAWILRIYFC